METFLTKYKFIKKQIYTAVGRFVPMCSKANDLSDGENLGECSMSLKILTDEIVVVLEQGRAKKIVKDYFQQLLKIHISYQVNYKILEFIISNYKVQLYIRNSYNNNTTTCKPYFKDCYPKTIKSRELRNSGFPKGSNSYYTVRFADNLVYKINKIKLIGNGVSVLVNNQRYSICNNNTYENLNIYKGRQ